MPSWIVRAFALAAVNFLTGKLGLLLAIPPGFATALWAPSGIALAAVLLWGYRMLPGVFLGSLLINVHIVQNDLLHSVLVASGIAAASTIQAAAGAWLIRRFVGFPNPLVRQRDVFAFFTLGGPIACLIAATLAVFVLHVSGNISTATIPFSWWTWWVGDSIGVLIFCPMILVVFGTPREIWARRKNTIAVPLLVAVAGLTAIFLYANNRERQRQLLEFNERCMRIADNITDQLHGYQEVLWSIDRFLESSEYVTREEFDRFTEPTHQRLPRIRALSWLPKVPLSEVPAFEARVQNEGFPQFRITERDSNGNLVPVRQREQYFPVLYIVPLEKNFVALGYDAASEPVRAEALERAFLRHEASATGPVHLVQDNDGQTAVIIVIPVIDPHLPFDSSADAQKSLRGYAAGVFRVDDVVDDALSAMNSDLYEIRLRIVDATIPGHAQGLYSGRWYAANADSHAPFTNEITYIFGGRKWILHLYATQEYLAEHVTWQSWWVDAFGFAFAALLGVFLLSLDGRAVELETANRKLSEAVKARDEFLSIASHELRTPLTPLKLQLQSAFRALAKDTIATGAHDRVAKSLNAIDNQVDRLMRLVDDLLDTSRITAGRLVLEKQPVDMRSLVTEVLERHRKELRGAATGTKIDAPQPVVGIWDRLRMEQVITNLVMNAIKYAPGKPLHISIRAIEETMILIFRDQGPGIAQENLGRIFERFERAAIPGQKGGLGLGLFIVRQIVEAHGGTIRAESKIGHGATFIIEMPLSAPSPKE